LGKLYSEKAEIENAKAAFRHASRLDVHDAESLNRIALLDVGQNRFQDAYEVQKRAISRQPDHPRQYLLLSDILEKMGRKDEARAALAQVHLLQAIAQSEPAAQSALEPN
jgi:Flp pilus assembly protein TadD